MFSQISKKPELTILWLVPHIGDKLIAKSSFLYDYLRYFS